MSGIKKKILWFTWYEWLIVIGIPIVAMVILLPPLLRISKEEMPGVVRVMNYVYDKMTRGVTSQKIYEQLSGKDKRIIEKHQIAWDSNVFPIVMEKGRLKNRFYPPSHVVVYANPRIVWTGERVSKYCSATGEMFGREDPNELARLLSVTRFATVNILLGTISDPDAAAKHCELAANPEVYSYLLLKALIDRDKAFMKYAIIIAGEKNHYLNGWLANILRSAIVSPPLPDLPVAHEQEELFYRNLSGWFEQNADRMQFLNTFLFEPLP